MPFPEVPSLRQTGAARVEEGEASPCLLGKRPPPPPLKRHPNTVIPLNFLPPPFCESHDMHTTHLFRPCRVSLVFTSGKRDPVFFAIHCYSPLHTCRHNILSSTVSPTPSHCEIRLSSCSDTSIEPWTKPVVSTEASVVAVTAGHPVRLRREREKRQKKSSRFISIE